MISKFCCLTSISPKDNSQFEGLHHKVGNKESFLLKFLKLTFGSMHIKSNSEFNSKLERTSDLFLLVCFVHFFSIQLACRLHCQHHCIYCQYHSLVLIIFDQSVVASWKTRRK